MPQSQPFTPDDIYCVYCHAVAAGPCAVCGALCCADCVEVVMGLTTPRAICAQCHAHNRRPGDARLWRWLAVGIAIAAAVVAAIAMR